MENHEPYGQRPVAEFWKKACAKVSWPDVLVKDKLSDDYLLLFIRISSGWRPHESCRYT